MSRLITFSRTFPSYHPKAGEPTRFIEKVWNSVGDRPEIYLEQFQIPYELGVDFSKVKEAKHHTVRAGHRWKAGDWFTPKVWGNDINPKSGRSGPYHSKPITFAPDIQVKKTWDFDIVGTDFFLDGKHQYALSGEAFDFDLLAKNDGLSNADLFDWFCLSPEFKKKQEFHGQIICWNEDIEY